MRGFRVPFAVSAALPAARSSFARALHTRRVRSLSLQRGEPSPSRAPNAFPRSIAFSKRVAARRGAIWT
jgi:hypothetical protein